MTNPRNNHEVKVLGVPIIARTLEEMVSTLVGHVENKEKTFVVTANPEIVLHAYENEDYRRTIDRADYVTADGIGVVKGAALLGEHIPERVTGFDLFIRLLQVSHEREFSLYLLGAQEEVLNRTLAEIAGSYPGAKIVGSHHGFFDWEDGTIADEIMEKKPDFVFVALGFPRQEQWIAKHQEQFEQGVFIGIGGSFDVLAGHVKRAPKIWQKLNLEWLYRLLMQPSRWRRMLALPKFIIKVFGQKVKKSHE